MDQYNGGGAGTAGWDAINLYMLPLIAAVLLAQLGLAWTERKKAATHAA